VGAPALLGCRRGRRPRRRPRLSRGAGPSRLKGHSSSRTVGRSFRRRGRAGCRRWL
jgi:hypothetical protein